jgi:hypothetical protein
MLNRAATNQPQCGFFILRFRGEVILILI